ncbi:hypothetical protein CONLIGDRAFT_278469 [Coniochaeta ligniaria NRRL 30616]|uniref:Uncharacterized protein n=1 Tax=Coniochaeta ligniaria NRRL 30616 TaxID=1408157 RepID=A0A1J7I494_9PEZI|nr:hypothetical protein CONLIGDRAFT_278469 [Coniochaeta ligniaria NRRL 30616]
MLAGSGRWLLTATLGQQAFLQWYILEFEPSKIPQLLCCLFTCIHRGANGAKSKRCRADVDVALPAFGSMLPVTECFSTGSLADFQSFLSIGAGTKVP